jgi:hypothetical protein
VSYCTDLSLLKDFGGHKTVATLRCRTWGCSHCGPRRATELRWRCRRAAANIFLTLTIRRGYAATPDLQAVELAKGWRLLRQHLLRTMGWKKLPFLCVIEKHKSGWPHAHLLLRCKYIPHQIIREWWQARFGSPHIRIEQVNHEAKAARYIAKYLAKAPHRFESTKRYWASHDFDLTKQERRALPDDGLYVASILRGTPEQIVNLALLDGAQGTWNGKYWLIEKWAGTDQQRWWQ